MNILIIFCGLVLFLYLGFLVVLRLGGVDYFENWMKLNKETRR